MEKDNIQLPVDWLRPLTGRPHLLFQMDLVRGQEVALARLSGCDEIGLGRFENEVEMISHPAIGVNLEGGSISAGRPEWLMHEALTWARHLVRMERR